MSKFLRSSSKAVSYKWEPVLQKKNAQFVESKIFPDDHRRGRTCNLLISTNRSQTRCHFARRPVINFAFFTLLLLARGGCQWSISAGRYEAIAAVDQNKVQVDLPSTLVFYKIPDLINAIIIGQFSSSLTVVEKHCMFFPFPTASAVSLAA